MDIKLHLHYGIYGPIERHWDGTTYYGTCWRLLYNHTHGARVVTRKETVNMTPDNLYLMPPGVSFTATQKNNPTQFGLHFHASEPFDHVQARVYAVPVTPLLDELLTKTLDEIRPLPFFLTDAGQLYATALTAAALTQIPPKYVEVKAIDLRIEEAMHYLNEKIDKRIALDDVARQVGLSKGAFIRLFKKETGATPYVWLTEARITWACDLLVRNTIPIDLIAQYTGFNDRFHFSKTFKQHIGIPPAAYRRREKQNMAPANHSSADR